MYQAYAVQEREKNLDLDSGIRLRFELLKEFWPRAFADDADKKKTAFLIRVIRKDPRLKSFSGY
jgi:hypothetical protein